MVAPEKFEAIEEIIEHMKGVFPIEKSPTLELRYIGFLSVSVVTTFELTVKDIYIDFASSKHTLFGEYIQNHFSRLNARVKYEDLLKQVKVFGGEYKTNFKNHCEILQKKCPSIISEYDNLILCRHNFVHGGDVTLTFQEIIKGYESGKTLLSELSISMNQEDH